jgi:hypothetical protein
VIPKHLLQPVLVTPTNLNPVTIMVYHIKNPWGPTIA